MDRDQRKCREVIHYNSGAVGKDDKDTRRNNHSWIDGYITLMYN